MIQKTNPRSASDTTVGDDKGLECWGQWCGHKYYSLEVVQHPLRARMCGFGDKDRRPLAPAAVAKMVVRRDDNSLVDVDELDCSFFLVTVDLWSADGKREMNLVLHPSSSADRYVPTTSTKSKKPRAPNPTTSSPRSGHPSPPSSHSTPNSATEPSRPPLDSQPVMTTVMSGENPSGYASSSYSYAPSGSSIPDAISYPSSATYNTSPDSSESWGFPPIGPHSSQNYSQPIRNASRSGMPASAAGESWNAQSNYRADTETTYRTWSATEPSYQANMHPQASMYASQDMDPSNRPYHPTPQPDARDYQWNQSQQDTYTAPGQANYDSPALYVPPGYSQQSPQPPYYQSNYAQSSTSSSSSPPSGPHPLPRHVYTRTLVGPLSSNACRLLDEHRRPGIFFLFQDLSVRTEGTFRLRLRLMNVGESPAPESGALRVHTNISPVLAQSFTDPFVVFSAKRFPGVPETTALSIAFGNQGQKLPLRNRHGTSKHGRRAQREGDSEGSESSDNA